MEEKSGMKKTPRAISVRPAGRAPNGRGPAAPASSGPPPQTHTQHIQAQPPTSESAKKTKLNDGGTAPPSADVKSYIERQLKSVYDDVLNQPIPDRFLELLNALDQSAEGSKPKTGDKA